VHWARASSSSRSRGVLRTELPSKLSKDSSRLELALFVSALDDRSRSQLLLLYGHTQSYGARDTKRSGRMRAFGGRAEMSLVRLLEKPGRFDWRALLVSESHQLSFERGPVLFSTNSGRLGYQRCPFAEQLRITAFAPEHSPATGRVRAFDLGPIGFTFVADQARSPSLVAIWDSII